MRTPLASADYFWCIMGHDAKTAEACPICVCKALAKQLRAEQGWISVTDRLPEIVECPMGFEGESVEVLVIDDANPFEAYVTVATLHPEWEGFCEHWTQQGRDAYRLDHVTHWMPLPSPPEDTSS